MIHKGIWQRLIHLKLKSLVLYPSSRTLPISNHVLVRKQIPVITALVIIIISFFSNPRPVTSRLYIAFEKNFRSEIKVSEEKYQPKEKLFIETTSTSYFGYFRLQTPHTSSMHWFQQVIFISKTINKTL